MKANTNEAWNTTYTACSSTPWVTEQWTLFFNDFVQSLPWLQSTILYVPYHDHIWNGKKTAFKSVIFFKRRGLVWNTLQIIICSILFIYLLHNVYDFVQVYHPIFQQSCSFHRDKCVVWCDMKITSFKLWFILFSLTICNMMYMTLYLSIFHQSCCFHRDKHDPGLQQT